MGAPGRSGVALPISGTRDGRSVAGILCAAIGVGLPVAKKTIALGCLKRFLQGLADSPVRLVSCTNTVQANLPVRIVCISFCSLLVGDPVATVGRAYFY